MSGCRSSVLSMYGQPLLSKSSLYTSLYKRPKLGPVFANQKKSKGFHFCKKKQNKQQKAKIRASAIVQREPGQR